MSFLGQLLGQGPSPVGTPQPADKARAATVAVNRPTAAFEVRPNGRKRRAAGFGRL